MAFKSLICRVMLVFACFGLLFVFCTPIAATADDEVLYDSVEDITLPSGIIYNNYSYAYKIFEGGSFADAKAFCNELGGELCSSYILKNNYATIGLKLNGVYLVSDTYSTKNNGELDWDSGADWASGYPLLDKNGMPDGKTCVYVKYAETNIYRYNCSQESFNEEYASSTVYFVCYWNICRCSEMNIAKGTVNPTCENNGKEVFYCKSCLYVINSHTLSNSHRFGDWAVVKGNAFIPPIRRERACELCNYKESVTDWGKIWVPVITVIGGIGVVIGLISYVKMMVKQGKSK